MMPPESFSNTTLPGLVQMNLHGSRAQEVPLCYYRRSHRVAFPTQHQAKASAAPAPPQPLIQATLFSTPPPLRAEPEVRPSPASTQVFEDDSDSDEDDKVEDLPQLFRAPNVPPCRSPEVERGTKCDQICLSPAGKFQRLLDAASDSPHIPPLPEIERGTKCDPICLSPAGKFQRLLDAASD